MKKIGILGLGFVVWMSVFADTPVPAAAEPLATSAAPAPTSDEPAAPPAPAPTSDEPAAPAPAPASAAAEPAAPAPAPAPAAAEPAAPAPIPEPIVTPKPAPKKPVARKTAPAPKRAPPAPAPAPVVVLEPAPAPVDNGWIFLGITGMFTQQSETGIGQVTDSWQYLLDNAVIPTSNSKPFKSSQSWNAGFEIGYNLPSSTNSVEFNFFQLSNDKHAVYQSDNAYSFASIFFPDLTIVNPSNVGLVSDSHLRYYLRQYDVFAAHQMGEVASYFSLKPSFGLRYAELSHRLIFSTPGRVMSKYNGIGPMVGLDGHFAFGATGFGLVGHMDVAALDGNLKGNSYISFAGNVYPYRSPNQNQIVPTLATRLGANYKYIFANKTSLNLEVGYQAAEYFNSFSLVRGELSAVDSLGSDIRTPKIAGIETTSFSYQGPYATLTYSFGDALAKPDNRQ